MLGEKIRDLRKRDGLSQEEVAEKLNVSRQMISKYELGETLPDLEKLEELTKLFEFSYDDLLEYKKEHSDVKSTTNKITIQSETEKMIGNYGSFKVSKVIKPFREKHYYGSLHGVSSHSIFGGTYDHLGYYATKNDLEKELEAIYSALSKGAASYTLQYHATINPKKYILEIIS